MADQNLNWEDYVASVRRATYFRLRQVARVRRCLPRGAASSLIQATVLPCIDYASSAPGYRFQDLQKVLNAAARLARPGLPCSCALRRLGWLSFPARVHFRVPTIVYRCLHGAAPGYLSKFIRRRTRRDGLKGTSATLEVTLVKDDKFHEAAFSCSARSS